MGRHWLRAALAVVIVALSIGWPLSRSAADPPPGPQDLKINLPGPRPTDELPRLDSALAALALRVRQEPAVEATAALGLTLEPGGTVRVIVEAEPGQGQAVEEGLRTGGYRVELRFEDLIQLRAEPARLAELSGLPGVRFVRRPFEPLPAVTSEGVSVIRADGWQAAGIRGQGVRVGVLDRGFYGYQALLGSELPPASRVIVRSFRADGDITGGGVQHGTGAAEVIYDIAPDATFYLANYSTSVEWANAVGWLVSEGVHVVNYSGGFLWCPANGNNFYTAQVDRARQNGVLWVNSAGNQARSHWWGYYNDPDTDRWLNFSFADEANDLTTFSSAFLSAGTPVWAWLCWEDLSYPLAPLYDYDLYLVDASSGLVIGPPCASENNQQTYRYPFEWFTCLLPYSGYYGLAVWCRSANCSPLTRLHLFVWRSREHPFELEYSTAVRSLITPADAAGSFTVGAVRWNDLGLEPYSSQGPTEDGRTKPDIVAPTRVSTWSYGYQGFGGTSASAPHVAGAAALVKAAFPQWGPAEIQAFLEGRARDLGPAGKDNAYGSGALDLGSAPTPPSAHRLWLPFIIRW